MADAALFNRMISDLKSSGMTESADEGARRRWAATSALAAVRPCWLCSTSGRTGRLTPLDKQDGVE